MQIKSIMRQSLRSKFAKTETEKGVVKLVLSYTQDTINGKVLLESNWVIYFKDHKYVYSL